MKKIEELRRRPYPSFNDKCEDFVFMKELRRAAIVDVQELRSKIAEKKGSLDPRSIEFTFPTLEAVVDYLVHKYELSEEDLK